MGKMLKYSVLRYSPSNIAGERINLGILLSDEESGYREFRYTRKFARLSSFDDELDIELVKKILKCIQKDVASDKYSSRPFDIDSYIKYYINDYCFDETKYIKYDQLDEMVDRLYKTYFRFDFEKGQRPSKSDDKKLLEEVIESKGIAFRRDKYIYGEFKDRIRYDIITDEYCIKVFDFDNKDLNRTINSAKTWAWNSLYCKEKKPVIIYRYNNQNEETRADFSIIMKIFERSNAQVYDIETGIQFLQKLSA